jgi:hypothetical protein
VPQHSPASPCLPATIRRCSPARHAAELREAGADQACIVSSEAGLNLGTRLLSDLGTPETAISFLRRGIHEALAVRTDAALQHAAGDSDSASSNGAALSSASSFASALSSMDGSSHAPDSGSTNGSSNGDSKKKQKKRKPEMEMFVLDGRYTYGMQAAAAAALAASPEPCADCPLVRSSFEEADAAAAAAAAGGGGAVSAEGASSTVAEPAASPTSSSSA